MEGELSLEEGRRMRGTTVRETKKKHSYPEGTRARGSSRVGQTTTKEDTA